MRIKSGIAGFVLAVLMAGSQIALAETTTLICTNNERPKDPQFTVDLDQSKSSVTINYNGTSSNYQATFEPKEITFHTADWDYTIDRVTAIVAIRARQNTSVVLHWTCHVGQAQF